MNKFLLVPLVACSLFVAAMTSGSASDDDRISSALAAAPAWVAQIDAGQYEESYADGCNALHERTPENQWVQVLSALRPPWGKVVSRKQTSHLYKPDGYQGTMGEFIVIYYDTSFAKLPDAIEQVVLKWEDGRWRGAGYMAGPKPKQDVDADGDPIEPQNNAQTDTSSQTTPTPPQ